MANNCEMSDVEEKNCLESAALAQKQVKKVDEQLTIEFTDIKQEPSYHVDHYQNFQEAKYDINLQCISCNTNFVI